MLNANCWWAKCTPHNSGDSGGLIPLDLDDNPSPTSSSRAAFHLRRRHRSLLNSAFLLIGALLIGLAISLIDRLAAPLSASRIDRFHREFLSSGSNASIARHLQRLTRLPHAAGSPENLLLADYIRDSFRNAGLTTHFSDYDVLLTFPLQRRLSLLRADGSLLNDLSLQEQKISGKRSIPGFHAFSPSGEAEGDVVYANYGRVEDFQELLRRGVNASGKLVLARYGEIFRGDIVENAAKAGASAAILYSDPLDFGGNGTGNSFPDSMWLPPGGVQRGTVLQGSGDPLTPGWPSVRGSSERLPVSEARLPTIPSIPISAEDAEPIIRALQGPLAPTGWQGGVQNLVYKLGGAGAVKLKFRYTANQTVSVIRNVFAVIDGFEEPDRFILLGNHRDAWTFGAVDPSSGTAALLEIAHRLGRLVKGGWKPRRSIVLCSWDAEEFGMIGSTEWVEQNLDLLGRAVAYLNVDCAVSGPGFHAGATPQLDDVLMDVVKKVKDPDSVTGGTVYDSWVSGSSNTAPSPAPVIDRLGSTGSDYVAFLHHAGVPAVDLYFGKSYPVYHSLYDNYEWMTKFGDPHFTRHVAVSSIWGLLALRLADCLVLPFDYNSYATQLQAYAKTVETALLAAKAPVNVSVLPLQNAVAEFADVAARIGDESEKMRKSNEVLQRRSLNDRLMQTERSFLEEGGLSGREWYKHLIYGPSRMNKYGSAAFPGVLDAVQEASSGAQSSGKHWRVVQHEIWRVSRVLARASLVLRGQFA